MKIALNALSFVAFVQNCSSFGQTRQRVRFQLNPDMLSPSLQSRHHQNMAKYGRLRFNHQYKYDQNGIDDEALTIDYARRNTIFRAFQKITAILCLAFIISLPLMLSSKAVAVGSGGRVGKIYLSQIKDFFH